MLLLFHIKFHPIHSLSVVYWLERGPYKAELAQQQWLEADTPSVGRGVTALSLANLFVKHSVAYDIWAWL